jgi:predicted Zn-dependent protease
MESEDELAGVVGHEIGHVVLHHVSKSNSTATAGKVAGFIGAVVTGQGQIMDATNQYTAEKVMGYGREHELEADRMGGELLAKAGYNPFAMLDVIQVLKDQEQLSSQILGEQKTYHGLFASHPQNDKRLHDAIAEGEKYLPRSSSRLVIFCIMNSLVYVARPLPASSRIDYYHEQLRVVVTFRTAGMSRVRRQKFPRVAGSNRRRDHVPETGDQQKRTPQNTSLTRCNVKSFR